jgi:hypothetical protein
MTQTQLIKKYYFICELFDDDVERVANVINVIGGVKDHKKTLGRLERLYLKNYEEHFDMILKDIEHYKSLKFDLFSLEG